MAQAENGSTVAGRKAPAPQGRDGVEHGLTAARSVTAFRSNGPKPNGLHRMMDEGDAPIAAAMTRPDPVLYPY